MKKNHNILQVIKWSCRQCHQRWTFHQDYCVDVALCRLVLWIEKCLGEMLSAGDTDSRII